MKLFCAQKDLDYAINMVNKAISPNNTLPVLNNILVKAEGKKLFFSSTNLEVAISCNIDADVRSEGAITIPAKLITSYISLLTDEKVEISLVDGVSVAVTSSTSNTKIKCISADEFPLIPKVEKGQEIIVKVDDLYAAITETVFAASLNTSRPVLSGVLMVASGDTVKMVATDSYRLAERTVKSSKKVDEEGLVHGGFIFGLADLAAMVAINHPNVVLGSAETRFIAPVRLGERVLAEARVLEEKGKKRIVEVVAKVGDRPVLTGKLTCFVLDAHVLRKGEG